MLTTEHKIILEQFRKHDGEHLSPGDLHSYTNIEPIKISAILADLMAHGMLRQEKFDDPGAYWFYTLSDEGRKFTLEKAYPGHQTTTGRPAAKR